MSADNTNEDMMDTKGDEEFNDGQLLNSFKELSKNYITMVIQLQKDMYIIVSERQNNIIREFTTLLIHPEKLDDDNDEQKQRIAEKYNYINNMIKEKLSDLEQMAYASLFTFIRKKYPLVDKQGDVGFNFMNMFSTVASGTGNEHVNSILSNVSGFMKKIANGANTGNTNVDDTDSTEDADNILKEVLDFVGNVTITTNDGDNSEDNNGDNNEDNSENNNEDNDDVDNPNNNVTESGGVGNMLNNVLEFVSGVTSAINGANTEDNTTETDKINIL